jgi:hypothetical protein
MQIGATSFELLLGVGLPRFLRYVVSDIPGSRMRVAVWLFSVITGYVLLAGSLSIIWSVGR